MRKIYTLSIFLFLVSSGLFSQVAATYTFSQVSGTFVPIITGGGATAFGGGADDDQIFGPFNIGFPFLYNNICYTQFCVDNNGFISMGPSLPLDSYNPISVGAANNVIAPFANDLVMGYRTNLTTTNGSSVCVVTSTAGLQVGQAFVNGNGFPNGTTILSMNGNSVTCSANATITSNSLFMTITGQKTYQALGVAPNRTLVVQWLRARKIGQVNDYYNFQIRLEETTNNISVVYGPFANNTNTMSLEVGLRGNNISDFNNRSTLTNWAATTSGISNGDYCLISNTVLPVSGLTFKWTFGTPIIGNTTVCGTNTNVLTAVGANTYSWSNGATTASVAVSPSVNTVYTVYAGYTGSCVSTNTVLVSLAANPTVSATGPTSVCSGQSVILSASGANSYSWSNGSTGASVAVSPTVTTTYTATGTNSATGCFATGTINVNLVATPTVNISGNQTVCAGQSINLTANGADTYSWSNGSLLNNISPVPSANTVYAVTGTSTLSGCAGNAAINVTVLTLPAVSISGPTAICIGQSANLSVSGANTYTWSNNSNATGISVTPTSNVTYSVAGTASNTCQNNAQINIIVNALPSVSLSAAINSVCINSGSVMLTGSPAGGTYSGPYVSGNSFNPLVTGTYTPLYAYTNTLTSCSNTANTSIIVSVCASENELLFSELSARVYPNPNNGHFTIQLSNNDPKVLKMMDLNGKLLWSLETNEAEIDPGFMDLEKGLYFLQVLTAGQTKTLKILVN